MTPSKRLWSVIRGAGIGRFPENHAHDGESSAQGFFKYQASNRFRRGILVDEETGLALILDERNGRIVLAQDHAMIQIFVDPLFHHAFDFAKIDNHAALIEAFAFKLDLDSAVMTVKKSAFPVVVEQTVPVTKIDFFGDAIHQKG